MTPPTKLPRLGDREGLRIELTRAAISTYRQSRATPSGPRCQWCVELTDAEAEEELLDVLGESYVTWSGSDSMRVRARVRRLEVDVEAELVRVTPEHVRVIFARARRLDTRMRRAGSGRGRGGYLVYTTDRSRRLGYLRATPDGGIEWREIAARSGAPAPPWGPPPADLREMALERLRAGDPSMARWLRKWTAIDIDG